MRVKKSDFEFEISTVAMLVLWAIIRNALGL